MDVAGKACQEDGSLVAAVNCYEMMTSIESVLGVRSVRLANAFTDLSVCYARQKRMLDAQRAQERAIALQKELNGSSDRHVVVLTANLGSYKSKGKDYAGADKVFKAALAQADSHSPPNPYTIGFTLNAMVESYIAQHRWADAEIMANRLVGVDDTLLSSGYYPFYAKESLAEIHARTGRFEEAEKEAKDALTRTGVADKIILVPAYEALGKVLIMQGKPDVAAAQFNLAMDILLEKYGKGDKTQYWRARYDQMLKEKDPFKE